MSVMVADRCTGWSCQITVGTRYLYPGASLDILQLTMVILHLDEPGKETSSGGQQWQDRWYHARGVEDLFVHLLVRIAAAPMARISPDLTW